MRQLILSAFLLLAGIGCTAAGQAVRAEPGSPTAFRVDVRGHGRPMILIPGFASSGEVWDGIVAHYQDRFECHILTLAGFAGAPASGEGAVMPLVREQLAAYVAAHHLDKPVVVGHSMGGVIALSLAAEHPEAVGQLVVVDSLPFLPAANEPSATPISLNEMALNFRNMLMSQPLDQRRAYQRRVLPTLISDKEKVEVALDWSMKSEGQTLGQAFYEMMTTDLRPELGRIHAPVLVMGSWAGTPGATRASVEQVFQSQYAGLSGVRIALVDRARHFIMWDDPSWLMQQMDSFL
ncbi:pimeloyl-ACP methyl ester carboxylesterase [Archangium gephyra]|uniref:Biotin synthesis protein BioH n=1 Tax=Archangium gephyra TaxID=48 RepID=A0AAC8QEY8_9BACT|nr:alpha/beta hydrolase [Archangium gephyra]AKJ06502.1 Biotin synthesis protein BioH [Archangium gephyra]REG32185.1 pimeloyl-ACP methyl ester carboxylesterase [Archangium gephyra]